MWEAVLSRRASQTTYFIEVRKDEKEFWRWFEIEYEPTAFAVFRAIDSFLHKIERKGILWNPKTDMLDQRVLAIKELVKTFPPGFNTQEVLRLLDELG